MDEILLLVICILLFGLMIAIKELIFWVQSIYEREKLPVGATFDGPAIIEQPDTTTVMPPHTHCSVDKFGNLIIRVDR